MANYECDATITNGVLRWNSNGHVPPVECVAEAAAQGLAVDVAACDEARTLELRAFLDAYRKNPPRPDLDEARAELGAGTVMVDIITGQRWQL